MVQKQEKISDKLELMRTASQTTFKKVQPKSEQDELYEFVFSDDDRIKSPNSKKKKKFDEDDDKQPLLQHSKKRKKSSGGCCLIV
jgi:hypothetical protein